MSRADKNSPRPHLPPVERIELSNDHKMWRLTAAIFLMLFGVCAMVYAFFRFMSADTGWQLIEASSSAQSNCAGDFVLLYNIGAGDASANEEKRALTAVYTDAAIQAYQLFSNDVGDDGVHNVYYINRHPNEVIHVDDVLYQAFSLLQSYGDRSLYLAPIYAIYDNVFYCNDDSELVDFDPNLNDALLEEFGIMAAYGRDVASVDLELLGDNQIRLYVSDEYLAYAAAEGIEYYIDFYWMKNAFIADYLADALVSAGYTFGTISSYDGFSRNLDNVSETMYSFNIFDRVEQSVHCAAIMEYTGARSIVFLRNFALNSLDYQHYYQLSGGDTRTAYLDTSDGLCKSALNDITAYSADKGCAEVLLQLIPIYIVDVFDQNRAEALSDNGVYIVYCRDGVVFYTDPAAVITELYVGEDVSYTASLLQ